MINNVVPLGKILKAHGLRGLMKIKSFTSHPEDFFSYGPFFLQEPPTLKKPLEQKPLFISPDTPLVFEKKNTLGGDLFLGSCPLIHNRTQGEQLEGYFLAVEASVLREKQEKIQNNEEERGEEEWLYVDLIGQEMIDDQGTFVDKVVDVVNYGGGDILVGSSVMVSFSLVDHIEGGKIFLKTSKNCL